MARSSERPGSGGGSEFTQRWSHAGTHTRSIRPRALGLSESGLRQHDVDATFSGAFFGHYTYHVVRGFRDLRWPGHLLDLTAEHIPQGYADALPFGPECRDVADQFFGRHLLELIVICVDLCIVAFWVLVAAILQNACVLSPAPHPDMAQPTPNVTVKIIAVFTILIRTDHLS